MISNPIEQLVAYLHEVSEPILKIANQVKVKAEALHQAEAEVVRCRRKLRENRRLLMACVRQHYVASEIKTADVMCNRQLYRIQAARLPETN
jgi:hypothetical protein